MVMGSSAVRTGSTCIVISPGYVPVTVMGKGPDQIGAAAVFFSSLVFSCGRNQIKLVCVIQIAVLTPGKHGSSVVRIIAAEKIQGAGGCAGRQADGHQQNEKEHSMRFFSCMPPVQNAHCSIAFLYRVCLRHNLFLKRTKGAHLDSVLLPDPIIFRRLLRVFPCTAFHPRGSGSPSWYPVCPAARHNRR